VKGDLDDGDEHEDDAVEHELGDEGDEDDDDERLGDVDFTDIAEDVTLDEHFDGLFDSEPEYESDEQEDEADEPEDEPPPERARFLYTLPPEQRRFDLHHQQSPGWVSSAVWTLDGHTDKMYFYLDEWGQLRSRLCSARRTTSEADYPGACLLIQLAEQQRPKTTPERDDADALEERREFEELLELPTDANAPPSAVFAWLIRLEEENRFRRDPPSIVKRDDDNESDAEDESGTKHSDALARSKCAYDDDVLDTADDVFAFGGDDRAEDHGNDHRLDRLGIQNPSERLQAKRFLEIQLPKFERGLELTLEYLRRGLRSVKDAARERARLLQRAYFIKGGRLRICPPEMTTRGLAKLLVEMGRPKISDRAMTDAERKACSRAIANVRNGHMPRGVGLIIPGPGGGIIRVRGRAGRITWIEDGNMTIGVFVTLRPGSEDCGSSLLAHTTIPEPEPEAMRAVDRALDPGVRHARPSDPRCVGLSAAATFPLLKLW